MKVYNSICETIFKICKSIGQPLWASEVVNLIQTSKDYSACPIILHFLKNDFQISANYKLLFDIALKFIGQLGWAKFTTLKANRGQLFDLQILKNVSQILGFVSFRLILVLKL